MGPLVGLTKYILFPSFATMSQSYHLLSFCGKLTDISGTGEENSPKEHIEGKSQEGTGDYRRASGINWGFATPTSYFVEQPR